MEDLQERFIDAITEQLDVERAEVIPTASFIDLGADSLDLVDMMMFFEEEFNVEIADEEFGDIKTVQDAFTFISGKIQ